MRLVRSSTFFTVFTLFTALVCGVSKAANAETFYGFWESQEPAGDACVINVKRGGRISSFYTGSGNSQITKGSWKIEDDQLIVEWQNGYRDVYTELGEGALTRKAFKPGSDITGPPEFETRAVRIDSRIPGSLSRTIQPKAPEEDDASLKTVERQAVQSSILPIRNDFNGYWKIKQDTGGFLGIGGGNSEFFYLSLQRNGTAQVALRNWNQETNIAGNWKLVDGSAVIQWPSGRFDRLTEALDGSYNLYVYEKEGATKHSAMRTAIRSNPTESGQFFNAGDIRMLTMTDIRGYWVPVENAPEDKSTHIRIEGWGNASRTPVPEGSAAKGEWKLLHDRIVVTWKDGTKDVIRYARRQWFQDSFAPGVPATGQPLKTIEVTKIPE